jgi:hypothetical protein
LEYWPLTNLSMKKNYFLFLAFLSYAVNAQTISVTTTNSLKALRTNHQSQVLPDGRVMVFGGNNGYWSNMQYYSTVEIFNPTTTTWDNGANMSVGRGAFASAILNDGRVLAIGGQTPSSYTSATCEVYNFQTNTWQKVADMKVARRDHSAIKLKNGQVLVAGGGGNTSELYNPDTDSWTLTQNLNEQRIQGASMVLLEDGKVLITGGGNNSAEIFDPQTNTWSLVSEQMQISRAFHQSVLLKNGKVLIVGTNVHSSNKVVETFDPATKTFTRVADLLQGGGLYKIILLDNGRVLLYTIGDFFTFNNTRCIQVYDPALNVWQSNNYNFTGGDDASINRLHNGEILIAGGNFSTGNGALSTCRLVQQTGYSGCSSSNLNLSINGESICYGASGKVSISGSEASTQYTAYIGELPVSNTVTGAGTINLSISSQYLRLGENVINVKVSKDGCLDRFLNSFAVITANETAGTPPQISSPGGLLICSGEDRVLEGPNGHEGYLWSNGATTSNISVFNTGVFSLRVKQAGCYSPPSNSISLNAIGNSISAGPSLKVCIDREAFQLEGQSHMGGSWTGAGVTSEGLFDPEQAGEGLHTLTYSACNLTSQREVRVYKKMSSEDLELVWDREIICMYRGVKLTIPNSKHGMEYQAYRGESTFPTKKWGNGDALTFDFNSITESLDIKILVVPVEEVCEQEVIEVQKTILLADPPALVDFVYDPVVCDSEDAKVIIHSEENILYQLFSFSQSSEHFMGNGDLLTIDVPRLDTEFRINARLYSDCNPTEIGRFSVTKSKIKANFTLSSKDYYIDEPVQIMNLSNEANSYQWSFDPTASQLTSDEAEPAVSYSSPGLKTIKLLVENTDIACSDEIEGVVNIHLPVNTEFSKVCGLNQINTTSNAVLDFHVDEKGNSYVSEIVRIDRWGRTYNLSLKKFDKEGKLLWQKQQTPYDYNLNEYHSSFITGIATDADENVYLTGSFSSLEFKVDDVHLKTSSQDAKFFVLKLNSSGDPQWIVHSDQGSNFPRGGTDILFSNGKIYVIAYRPGRVNFTDKSTVDFNNELVFIEINSNGEFLNSYAFGALGFNSMFSNLATFRNPDGMEFNTRKVATESPKMKVDKNGIIVFSGRFSSAFQLGDQTLSPLGWSNVYVGELDPEKGFQNAFTAFGRNHSDNFFRPFEINDDFIFISDFYWDMGQPELEVTFNNGYQLPLERKRGSFISKFSRNGDFHWVSQQLGSMINDIYYSHEPENLLMTGSFDSFMVIPSQDGPSYGLKSFGKSDAFLASVSNDGDINWVDQIGGSGDDNAFGLAKDDCGNFRVLGNGQLNVQYNDASFNSATQVNFIAQLSLTSTCDNQSCEYPSPEITSFAPAQAKWGQSVKISGTNLKSPSLVSIGEIRAAVKSSSETEIDIIIPKDASNGKITVVTSGGTAVSVQDLVVIPSITDFSPKEGPIGQQVIVSGGALNQISEVKFNGTVANFIIIDNKQLQFTVPEGSVTGKVSLKYATGMIETESDFVVVLSPHIKNVTPWAGLRGSEVTISGKEFSKVTSVAIGNINTTFEIISDEEIKLTVPANAVTGPVKVTSLGGTAVSVHNFKVLLPPVIHSFSPDHGTAKTVVTIQGENFINVLSVFFNGVPSPTWQTNSFTQISAQVPEGVTYGKISVSNQDGVGVSSINFIPIVFTINPPTELVAIGKSEGIELNWKDNSDNEEEFWIFRSNSPDGDFQKIGSVVYDETSYLDESIQDDETYYYKVYAWSIIEYSDFSNIASGKRNQGATTGTNTFERYEITVYPNPGDGLFFINLNAEIQAEITVLDRLGRHILDIKTSQKQRVLDLSGYPSGVYTLKITTKYSVEILQIVKK